jgi:hypothetical protein
MTVAPAGAVFLDAVCQTNEHCLYNNWNSGAPGPSAGSPIRDHNTIFLSYTASNMKYANGTNVLNSISGIINNTGSKITYYKGVNRPATAPVICVNPGSRATKDQLVFIGTHDNIGSDTTTILRVPCI